MKPVLIRLGLLLPLACWQIFGGQPRIELIEPFGTNQVLIHFDTEANRVYQLQYLNSPASNGAPAVWSNLFVAPSLPTVNHYIVPDTRTTSQRLYRLRVTP